MNAEAARKHREAVMKAEKNGKTRPTLMAARLFAFKNGFEWLHYDEISDLWHGSNGEAYSTDAILRGLVK
jgi:hypothetical protein